MDLSIIIIAKDKNADITEALNYIYKQKSVINYEVLCVKEQGNEIVIPNQYKNCVKIIDAETLSKALNFALQTITSEYFIFMFPTDIWHDMLIFNLVNSIKNKHTDCVIFGMNLNKKYKIENLNTAFLDFNNYSKKLQEEVFFVSEIGYTFFNFPEFINNKIYRTEFIKENNIIFENDDDFEQLFYYKFMFSDPKFILLNNYLSRRIFCASKDIITMYNKVEKYLTNSSFDDKMKIKIFKKLQIKKLSEMITYKVPLKNYKNYHKVVRDEIKKMLEEKKIYEYEVKMDGLCPRFYKFMNTNYLTWYFCYREKYIK